MILAILIEYTADTENLAWLQFIPMALSLFSSLSGSAAAKDQAEIERNAAIELAEEQRILAREKAAQTQQLLKTALPIFMIVAILIIAVLKFRK